jgi:hypothetical protein
MLTATAQPRALVNFQTSVAVSKQAYQDLRTGRLSSNKNSYNTTTTLNFVLLLGLITFLFVIASVAV